MVRSRSAPWLGAVAALLAAPQFAPAGPLSWGFRAEAPDGTVLREVTGITDLFYGDHFLADPQYHGVFKGGVSGPGYRTERWETEAQVVITDEASGESDSFRLWWRWVMEYEVRPDGSEDLYYEGYNSGPWMDPAVLTLGGNTYTIRGPGGDLSVTVTPAVATPEPATLALAGVGLVPLLGRVARRRFTPCA
jgi:hypothetical protein